METHPITAPERSIPDQTSLEPSAQRVKEGPNVPQTIALVDDDRNILTSIAMALEAEGFTVKTYSDGAEALKGLTAQPVDLAVLDIKLSLIHI